MNERAVPQPGLHADGAFDTTVLLIRHGQSAAIVPGSPESHDPPLSNVGQVQAEALWERLASARIDAVYASNLARATETAAGLAKPRGLDVQERPDLREVFLGDWEGGGFRQRAADGDPEFLAFAAAGRWDLIPGCEGDDSLRARATAAVDEFVDLHRGVVVAVVCHSGWINAWLAGHWGANRSIVTSIENTSITTVRAGAEGRRMVTGVNDHHHLGDPLA